ncbi:MAG: hypothetical protein ACOYU3_04810 [Bacillota bacterium]
MVIKTIPLKLYRPSARKQMIIDDAFLRYSRAFGHLLESLRDRLSSIQTLPATRIGLMQCIDKTLLNQLNAFGVEPFKDGLKMDAAITLSTYFGRLRAGKKATYPLSCLDDAAFDERFNALCDTFLGEKDFLQEYDRLLEKFASTRPLLFCRHDAARDYSLLYDPEKDRFYAKLYLLNAKSPLRLPPDNSVHPSSLRYVGNGGRRFVPGRRAKRYIIVPLAFGKWQEAYLKKALSDPGILKTAQLIRKGKDIYLSVKIACAAESAISVKSYMGVARSLRGYLCCSVHENEHTELFSGNIFSREDVYAEQTVDEALLHRLSNEVIRIAAAYNSQLVLYALGKKRDMLDYNGVSPLLSMGQYNRLTALISYKAELSGLARPITVSPALVFHACPVCRANSRKNRMNQELFLCTSCGYIRDVEQLGSRNLALMLHTYRKNKIVFKVCRRGDSIGFTNPVLEFDFVSLADEYAYERFFNYLRKYIGNALEQTVPKKKLSILKKLARLENLKDGIVLVES